jgi:SAM-dependent methyltransferase
VARALEAGLGLAEGAGATIAKGPLLDLGCAVGRGTFELAKRTTDLVLGVDMGFHMLRLASRVLRRGSIRYPLRRGGVLYDWREFDVPIEAAERVDFWACDATQLPFGARTFGGAVALNLIDCVYSPLDLLRSVAQVLRSGGALLLAAPYDWTPAATTIEAWIGGHSPRSAGGGASSAVLRALLTPGAHPAAIEGLHLVAERDDVPWTVRMHDRSTVTYRLHMVVASRR